MIRDVLDIIITLTSSLFGMVALLLWAIGVLYLWPTTGLIMTYVMLVFPPWPFVAGVGVLARMFGVPV